MRKIAALGTALALLPSTAMAQTATGPDYSSLTGAIDFDTTIAAILSVGALAVGLALVTVGIRKILRMVKGA